jgi:tRNA U55 pseudouridine synthase TruB
MYELARVNPVRGVICFPACRMRRSSCAADLQSSRACAGDRCSGPTRPHREDRLARLFSRVVSPGTSSHSCTPWWFIRLQQLTNCRQRIPQAWIHVKCGSGTYIRSIARECGEALVIPSRHVDSTCQLQNTKGELCVGGTLAALERTRNGAFTLSESVGLEDLEQLVQVSPHRSSRCHAARSILTSLTAVTQTQQSPLQSIESALLHLPFVVLPSKSAHRWEIGGIVCISLDDALTEEHGAVALQDGNAVRVYEGSAGCRRFRGVTRVETQPEGDHFILRKRTFV